MLKVGGFPEYNLQQQEVFDNIYNIVEKNYQSFSYQHIDTPNVEKNDTLLAKGGDETSKQIFGLYGLAQGAEDQKNYSLRFDLTVPFSRYVIDHKNELNFPFKRYQIGKVFRGERQQKGRAKEFYQADIDILWDKEQSGDYTYYDAEIVFVLYKTLLEVLNYLNIDDKPFININNRKVIEGFLEDLGAEEKDFSEIISIIDDFFKSGEEKTKELLSNFGFDSSSIEKLLNFLKTDIQKNGLDSLYNLSNNEKFVKGVNELKQVQKFLSKLNKSFGIEVNYKINLFIVRGLDYYTGTIFETILEKNNDISSIGGGGRYDDLCGFLDKKSANFAGVGGSIGLTRFLDYIFDKLDLNQKIEEKYLILNFEETQDISFDLFSKFQKEGFITELYPFPSKLKKQFQYADRKLIKYTVICGQQEKEKGIYKIRDMESGEENDYSL